MRRNTNMYSGYRGRRSAHDILLTVALVLVVLVVLVLGGLYLGQRYIVYTDEGIRLELPFAAGWEMRSEAEPGDLSIKEESRPQEQPEPVTPVEPQVVYKRGTEVPLEAVLDGTAGAGEASVLIVTMKDREGRLGFVSQRPEAERAGVNRTGTDVNRRIQDWNEEQDYTVARVVCFADNSIPYHLNSLALRATYGNWRDLDQKRWMDPTNPACQDYVAALCGELARLGFDEILLEEAACPVDGNQEVIRWTSTNLSAAVSGTGGFLEKVRQAVEGQDTLVSIRVDETVLDPEAPHGGLTAESLNRHVRHIWMEGGSEDLEERLAAAGISDVENRLVELLPEFSEDIPHHQAKLLS